MGIHIKYKGSLANTANVSKISRELKNLATTLNWNCREWNDDWSQPCNARMAVVDGKKTITGHFSLKGATLGFSEKSEGVPILFNARGQLRNPINLLGPDSKSHEKPIAITIKNTTSDNFIWVMGLLKYMKKHYMSDLEVYDDASYWESNDRQKVDSVLAPGNSSASQYSADQIASKLETMFKVMHN